MPLGIGIVTFRRLHALMRTVERVQKHTKTPYFMVVADDGSGDMTVEWCRKNDITVVTGKNRGVCWNKNRALFILIKHTEADPIILLEDDCYPDNDGWDEDWIEAANHFGHVNYAHVNWPSGWCRGGNGTPSDPWISWEITGQATITTRAALLHVGYLNTRFKGYGYGHIEWTERFCKANYFHRSAVPCIRCGLAMEDVESFRDVLDIGRNYRLMKELQKLPFNYCEPWSSTEEMRTLHAEVEEALAQTPLIVRGKNA